MVSVLSNADSSVYTNCRKNQKNEVCLCQEASESGFGMLIPCGELCLCAVFKMEQTIKNRFRYQFEHSSFSSKTKSSNCTLILVNWIMDTNVDVDGSMILLTILSVFLI